MMINYKAKKEKATKSTGNSGNANSNSDNGNSHNKEAEKQVGFAQKSIEELKKNTVCGRCKQYGHWWKDPECPMNKNKKHESSNAQAEEKPRKNAFNGWQATRTQDACMFEQTDEFGHLKDMMSLDNQSTTDIFCNAECLENVRKVDETMSLKTNAGVLECNMKGTLPGLVMCGMIPKPLQTL